MPITKVCQYCGDEFSIQRGAISQGRGKFCSRKCYDASRQPIECVCKHCGKKFKLIPSLVARGRGKFCSRDCLRASRPSPPLITRVCDYCGREFEPDPGNTARGRGRFCSPECFYKWEVGENAPTWNGGTSYLPYPPTFNEAFKKMIHEREDYTCAICGMSDSEHIHHINYKKDDTTPENCIALCASCHARTNNNRRYWRKRLQDIMAEREIIRAEQLELALL